ncbi:MAG: glycosyltransferase [Anaerolineae bacterium]|jgi:sugar transferase (PEP-CTERM/EpsH1 system associated)
MVAESHESKRRILFLTPQMPYPPEQGTALRNFNLITQIATQHDVALLTFAEPGSEPMQTGPLSEICSPLQVIPAPTRTMRHRLRTLLLSDKPDMAQRLASPAYADALRHLLSNHSFDIVQVEGIEMAPYGLLIRQWLGQRSPPILFDAHNAEYLLQKRTYQTDIRHITRWPGALYSLIQWKRLERFERQICGRADAVATVSSDDARALRRLVPFIDLVTVPNGVDIERYHPGLPDSLSLDRPAVLFTGKMDYRPNVDAMLWFHRQVWPQVRQRVPDARLYVVGKSPHRRLAPLQRDPSVHLTGYVPDILPYFGGADAYVVPLRMGGGTRLKVLEAMAAGVPLVSTPLGAEGIDLDPEEHAIIADTPDAFAEGLVRVIQDIRMARTMAAAARRLVEQQYDWQSIAPRLEAMYAGLSRGIG